MASIEGQIIKKNITDYVTLADGEVIIKDYYAATVKKPSHGEAHIAATTKRVILYIWTKESFQVNGANIADVLSTDIYWSNRRRRKLGIVLLLVGFFLSLWPLINSLYLPTLLIALPLLAIGIYYVIKKRTTFSIIIHIKAATGSLFFNNYPQNVLEKKLNPGMIRFEAKPGPDANVVAKELGALILNMQKVT
jgi:hypothetical protein